MVLHPDTAARRTGFQSLKKKKKKENIEERHSVRNLRKFETRDSNGDPREEESRKTVDPFPGVVVTRAIPSKDERNQTRAREHSQLCDRVNGRVNDDSDSGVLLWLMTKEAHRGRKRSVHARREQCGSIDVSGLHRGRVAGGATTRCNHLAMKYEWSCSLGTDGWIWGRYFLQQ